MSPVTVNSHPTNDSPDVAGFGDYAIKDLPLSVQVIDQAQMQAAGSRRLADLARFDASVTDAYNAAGYWDFLSIRGFTIDNRYNYRREGLPISAETSIPLDNKERVEILKGTSGIQAGTSAPGGLVNFVVKRPTHKDLREARLELSSRSSVLSAVDLGGRFGPDSAWGYRLNAGHETLRPLTQHLNGQRDVLAGAVDWRVNADALLQAEVEWSRKSQPSQQPYSLLGASMPGPVDPARNLNSQAWSQPSVFDALTHSLRWLQALGADWRWSVQIGSQRLKSDDRLAYAFGCGAEKTYDRFCSDGTFDLYDFRSENEQRAQSASQIKFQGKLAAAGVQHDLSLGLTHSQLKHRFQAQAYNWVGIGQVQGAFNAPADPSLTTTSTQRDEKSLEWSIQDTVAWTPRLTTWLGLRSTQLARSSVSTDGSSATDYTAALHTPWLALQYALSANQSVYASVGQGVETQVVPNKPSSYSNAGVALAPLKSTQVEVGFKGQGQGLSWQVNAFRITRPMSNLDACARLSITPCQGQYDGSAVHTGQEASGQVTLGDWQLGGGLTLIDAKRKGSVLEASTNGQRPTNVPAVVLRAQSTWRIPGVPGLTWQTQWLHEGNRAVLPDNSLMLPSWNRLDTRLSYAAHTASTHTTWTLGIDNLTNRRYWQESPSQYGHVYLLPAAARTIRLGVLTSL